MPVLIVLIDVVLGVGFRPPGVAFEVSVVLDELAGELHVSDRGRSGTCLQVNPARLAWFVPPAEGGEEQLDLLVVAVENWSRIGGWR